MVDEFDGLMVFQAQWVIGSNVLSGPTEAEDQAQIGVVEHFLAGGGEVLAEAGVMVEPPQRGGGEKEIFSPRSLHALQVADRVGAPGRMVAGIGAVRVLGEMAGVPPLEIEQVGITLAGDEDRGTGGDDLPGDLLDPADECAVRGTRAMPMRAPLNAPFALEAFAVGRQQLLILARCAAGPPVMRPQSGG